MTKYSTLDDKRLLIYLNENDISAFDEIFRRYNGILFIFAHKLCRNEEDARDIVQDLFINLWTNRNELSVTNHLFSYLYKSVQYGFLKKVRSEKVHHQYLEKMHTYMSNVSNTTDEYLLEKELLSRLEKMAAKLPGKMGRIFILNHFRHQTVEEIATSMEISEKTVRNLLSEANKMIRMRLGYSIFIFL